MEAEKAARGTPAEEAEAAKSVGRYHERGLEGVKGLMKKWRPKEFGGPVSPGEPGYDWPHEPADPITGAMTFMSELERQVDAPLRSYIRKGASIVAPALAPETAAGKGPMGIPFNMAEIYAKAKEDPWYVQALMTPGGVATAPGIARLGLGAVKAGLKTGAKVAAPGTLAAMGGVARGLDDPTRAFMRKLLEKGPKAAGKVAKRTDEALAAVDIDTKLWKWLGKGEKARPVTKAAAAAEPGPRAQKALEQKVWKDAHPTREMPEGRRGPEKMVVNMDDPGGPVTAPDAKPRNIINELEMILGTKLDQRIRRGKKGVRGHFNPRANIGALRKCGDMPTAFHEFGHGMSVKMFGDDLSDIPGAVDQELEALGKTLYGDVEPKGGYASEGFAEYWWLYFNDAPNVATRAPHTHVWMQGVLKENPKLLASISHAQESVNAYRLMDPRRRILAGVAASTEKLPDPIIGRWRKWALRRKTALTDRWSFMEYFEKMAGVRAKDGTSLIPGNESPYGALRIFGSGLNERILNAMKVQQNDVWGQWVGPALEGIMKDTLAKKHYQDFTAYILAKHTMEARTATLVRAKKIATETGRDLGEVFDSIYRPTGNFSVEDAAAAVKFYESDPQWAHIVKAQREWTTWHNNYQDMILDAGGYTAEQVKAMREAAPAYTPVHKITDDLLDMTGGKKGVGDLAQPSRRRKGSVRTIKDPLEQARDYARRHLRAAEQLHIQRALAELAEHPGMGAFIEKVPASLAPPATTTVGEMRRALEAAGLPADKLGRIIEQDGQFVLRRAASTEAIEAGEAAWDDLGAFGNRREARQAMSSQGLVDFDQSMNVFSHQGIVKAGEPVFFFWKDGKQNWYRAHPEIYKALMETDAPSSNMVVKWFFGPATRAIRLGATQLRPGFAVSNALRDLPTFLVQSELPLHKSIPAWMKGQGRAVKAVFAEDELFKWAKGMGLDLATEHGWDRAATIAKKLAQKGKATHYVRHPLDALRVAMSWTEMGPRLAEAEAVLRRLGWKPGMRMTPRMSAEAAMAFKDVTVDFSRSGTIGRVMNQIVPFWNSATQGPARAIKAYRQNPGAAFTRTMITGAAPAVGLWWLNKDKAWWKDQPGWLRMFLNIDTNDYDKTGEGLIRIPTSHEHGLLGGLMVALLDNAYQEDKEGFGASPLGEWSKAAAEYACPVGLPLDTENAKEAVLKAVGSIGAIGPMIEVMANKTWYGGSIVPPQRGDLATEQQFREDTTETSKGVSGVLAKLGDFLNMDPASIDYLLYRHTGGVGLDALKGLEVALRKVGVMPEGAVEPPPEVGNNWLWGRFFWKTTFSRSVGEMYDERQALKIKDATWEQMMRDQNPKADRYRLSPKEGARLNALNEAAEKYYHLMQQSRQVGTEGRAKRLRLDAVKAARDVMRTQRE